MEQACTNLVGRCQCAIEKWAVERAFLRTALWRSHGCCCGHVRLNLCYGGVTLNSVGGVVSMAKDTLTRARLCVELAGVILFYSIQ